MKSISKNLNCESVDDNRRRQPCIFWRGNTMDGVSFILENFAGYILVSELVLTVSGPGLTPASLSWRL